MEDAASINGAGRPEVFVDGSWLPICSAGASGLFDAPRGVKAVAVAMRGSQSWGYFGINSAALIAEPGPFMLVR